MNAQGFDSPRACRPKVVKVVSPVKANLAISNFLTASRPRRVSAPPLQASELSTTACKPYPIARTSAGAGVEAARSFFARLFGFDFGMEEGEKEGDHHMHSPASSMLAILSARTGVVTTTDNARARPCHINAQLSTSIAPQATVPVLSDRDCAYKPKSVKISGAAKEDR